MTASSPPPADDKVREQLVSRLNIAAQIEGLPLTVADCGELVDHLLPAVSALLTEARADELEQAAREQDEEALRLKIGAGSHRGGHECAADHLRDRAMTARAAVRRTEGN